MEYRWVTATRILAAPFWFAGIALFLLLEFAMLLLAVPLMLLVSPIGTYSARRDREAARKRVRLQRPFDLSKMNSWLEQAEALQRRRERVALAGAARQRRR